MALSCHAELRGAASAGNTTRALITALRGAGLPLTEFGYEAGHVTNWISELETA